MYKGAVTPSPAKIPVSAVVITLNAERWLEAALAPLAVCAEIVVLDSGSTDRTEAIAGAAGARWHSHPFDGYGAQKRRAVALAENDWILSVDGDEILEAETVAAIAAIDWAAEDPGACWAIRRRPFVGGREIRHGHWVPDPVVRLFNRRRHNFSAATVHESVAATGQVHRLPGAMRHHSYDDLAAVFRAEHHRLKAAEYRKAMRRVPGAVELTARAGWAFVYSLVLKRGFLDGPAGVVIALSGAVNAVLGLALAGSEPAPEPEVFERDARTL